jgi:hypothetical protein
MCVCVCSSASASDTLCAPYSLVFRNLRHRKAASAVSDLAHSPCTIFPDALQPNYFLVLIAPRLPLSKSVYAMLMKLRFSSICIFIATGVGVSYACSISESFGEHGKRRCTNEHGNSVGQERDARRHIEL